VGLRLHLVLLARDNRAAWHELHARRLSVQMAGSLTRLLRLSCVLVIHAMRMVTTMHCAVTLCQMSIVSACGQCVGLTVATNRSQSLCLNQEQAPLALLRMVRPDHAITAKVIAQARQPLISHLSYLRSDGLHLGFCHVPRRVGRVQRWCVLSLALEQSGVSAPWRMRRSVSQPGQSLRPPRIAQLSRSGLLAMMDRTKR
jgi:hypothetical protein